LGCKDRKIFFISPPLSGGGAFQIVASRHCERSEAIQRIRNHWIASRHASLAAKGSSQPTPSRAQSSLLELPRREGGRQSQWRRMVAEKAWDFSFRYVSFGMTSTTNLLVPPQIKKATLPGGFPSYLY